MGIYSISDLASLTGVKTHTLRVWEKRYGLLRPHRNDSNVRYYLDQDLADLRLIVDLYQGGVKISRIAEMNREELLAASRDTALRQKNHPERLYQAVLAMDATSMDEVLDQSISKIGFEATLIHLIIPLLEKMEVLWVSGSIDEAHETCFREVVKRKCIREIDKLPHHCKGPKVIMFLPQGNHQELNHLFMHYFLRKHGLCVMDMGCDIQLDCACSAAQKIDAECILIVNQDPGHMQFGAFIRKLVERTSLPIIISGSAAEEQWSHYDGQVIALDSIEETLRFVSRLRENLRNLIS